MGAEESTQANGDGNGNPGLVRDGQKSYRSDISVEIDAEFGFSDSEAEGDGGSDELKRVVVKSRDELDDSEDEEARRDREEQERLEELDGQMSDANLTAEQRLRRRRRRIQHKRVVRRAALHQPSDDELKGDADEGDRGAGGDVTTLDELAQLRERLRNEMGLAEPVQSDFTDSTGSDMSVSYTYDSVESLTDASQSYSYSYTASYSGSTESFSETELSDVSEEHDEVDVHEELGVQDGDDGERIYPEILEQSDAFTALVTEANQGVREVQHKSFDWLLEKPQVMDRYMRMVMHTLMLFLTHVARGEVFPTDDTYDDDVILDMEDDDPNADVDMKIITMRDLVYYLNKLDEEVIQAFMLRVERVLNSSGMSLDEDEFTKFNPIELAKEFRPIMQPTKRMCECDGNCMVRDDEDPYSRNYCPCRTPKKRKCGPHCGCAPSCQLRFYDPDEDLELIQERREQMMAGLDIAEGAEAGAVEADTDTSE